MRLRPVEQTRLDADGNCFEACLASLLGVPIERVPPQPPADEDLPDYMWRELNEWLAPKGLQLLTVPVLEFEPSGHGLPDAYWIACVSIGSTDRWHHAVVVRGKEIVWDPDPRGSLPALTADNVKQMSWLVPAATPKEKHHA